jgi:hypothetical protein
VVLTRRCPRVSGPTSSGTLKDPDEIIAFGLFEGELDQIGY